jgi:hypothetical protein
MRINIAKKGNEITSMAKVPATNNLISSPKIILKLCLMEIKIQVIYATGTWTACLAPPPTC